MQTTSHSDIQGWITELHEELPNGQCECPQFLKPFHLVTMGLAIKQAGWENFKLPEALSRYAARMELWESVDIVSPVKVNKRSPSGKFLPVQRFDKDNRNVSNVVSRLQEIVANTASEATKNALDNCLQELINNFFDHANSDVMLPCLVAAQSWPKGKLIQVAIADAGIGIRASLEENHNLQGELRGGNACEIASKYSITSKPGNGHSGYGLTLTRDLMEQANGNFILFSGKELFSYTNGVPKSYSIPAEWKGTLLILEWNIDTTLDAKCVYRGWPIPNGFNANEFF